MPDFHLVVCMKVTPKPEEIRVDPDTHLLVRESARSEINPPDMNALEMALTLRDQHGGRVSILSMGPAFFEPTLRVAIAVGAEHLYLLSDRAFAGADTLATTYTLARAVEKIGDVDLILCGEESSDGATGQVPSGIAEWLNMGHLSVVDSVTVDGACGKVRGRRSYGGGHEVMETRLPCVVSVKTAANEPRFIDYRRKPYSLEPQRVTVWSAEDVNADPSQIGLRGSPTMVTGLAQAPVRERKQIFLEGSRSEKAEQLAGLLLDIL